MPNLRQFAILTDIDDTELYDFEAPTWKDARDTLIGTAFEHQLLSSKKFKPDVIVRSQMIAHNKYEISFTADKREFERWKLREKNGGLRGWYCNWIASMSHD